MKPFFISIPHSGEKIPKEVTWLQGLPEPVLMRDVDRFVDRIYAPVIEKLNLVSVKTQWHRYVIDLNRLPGDIDPSSVIGNESSVDKKFASGIHWTKTTQGEVLLAKPMSLELHNLLVEKYYWPFHKSIEATYAELKQSFKEVFHLDAHSMPSLGTAAHPDPGETRAEIVISDLKGKSCRADFFSTVVDAYKQAGFQVKENWPYVGGRVTELYGKPQLGQHAIQVEMNRSIYMDETTKQIVPHKFAQVQIAIGTAIEKIWQNLPLES